jgi:HD-like signal output (HDOD) protein
VIERIHPLIGEKLLKVWDFPDMLVQVPQLYLNFKRQSAQIDYVDLVQVASLYCHKDTDHPFARIDPLSVPAFNALGIDIDNEAMCADLEETRSMFY